MQSDEQKKKIVGIYFYLLCKNIGIVKLILSPFFFFMY